MVPGRERLWDCYEHAVAASKARAKVMEQREIDLALKDDANNKTDRWIHTKQVNAPTTRARARSLERY